MVVRMWHGRVPAMKAQRYREFLNLRAIPDYRSVPGNISVHILERQDGPVDALHHHDILGQRHGYPGFAGDDVLAAKYYPEGSRLPSGVRAHVVHYEVVGSA